MNMSFEGKYGPKFAGFDFKKELISYRIDKQAADHYMTGFFSLHYLALPEGLIPKLVSAKTLYVRHYTGTEVLEAEVDLKGLFDLINKETACSLK